MPNKPGRPSKYSDAIADAICERIANGESSRSICDAMGIPQRSLWDWLAANDDFSQQYARAKNIGVENEIDEMKEIADTDEDAQRARNRIDVRKFRLVKILPKKYGDKVQQEISGTDGAPIQAAISVTFVRAKNGESLP